MRRTPRHEYRNFPAENTIAENPEPITLIQISLPPSPAAKPPIREAGNSKVTLIGEPFIHAILIAHADRAPLDIIRKTDRAYRQIPAPQFPATKTSYARRRSKLLRRYRHGFYNSIIMRPELHVKDDHLIIHRGFRSECRAKLPCCR